MAYPHKNDPNNPDAIPLYVDSIFKFWTWFDNVWNCNDWKTWHIALVKKYGKSNADVRFLKHWNNQGQGAKGLDCRTFNTSFREYFKKQNLMDAIYEGAGIFQIVLKPSGNLSDTVTYAGDGISSIFKTIKTILPIILIVLGVLFIVYAYKKTEIKK